MELHFTLETIDETARQLLEGAPGKLLAFYAPMGAGKTTLIKALLRQLGAADRGSSPTFGLVNEYRDQAGELLAYHFDFYRLEKEEEALDLGLDDYLEQGAWVFMEWPEKVEGLLPDYCTKLQLEISGDKERVLRMQGVV